MKTKKREPDPEKPSYEPTSQEHSVLRKHVARREAQPPAPRLKVLKDRKPVRISLDHSDAAVGGGLLAEALSTADLDFVQGLLDQLINVGRRGDQVDEDAINFVLSVVKGIKPNDQLEVMLAAQMAAIHMATMRFARRLANVENIPQQDSAERALNKLARTFTTQMEALKRYRTGGEQKVTVQHVSVSEGGQAIVGNVTQAARETAPEKPANLTPAVTDAQKPAMTVIDEPECAPVPLGGRQKDDGRSSA